MFKNHATLSIDESVSNFDDSHICMQPNLKSKQHKVQLGRSMTHGAAYWLTAFRSLTAKLNELWCAVISVTGLELLHLVTQTQQTEETGNLLRLQIMMD